MQLIINILTVLTIVIYANYLFVKKLDIRKDKFEGEFFNTLNAISYAFPFNKLLDDKRKLNKREIKINEQIQELDLGHYISLRSFMTLKFLLLFVPLIVVGVILFIVNYFSSWFSIGDYILLIMMPFVLAYVPDLYLIKRKLDFEKFQFDEVVILQLFMVLLIKSNSTTEDILYAFAKMETYHKRTFEKAYRISLRSKSESLHFLGEVFQGTTFGGSFKTLDDMYKYSKEDSLRILKANLKTIEKDSLRDKTRKELTKFSYSQISVVIPFAIVIFLGALPIIQYGVNMISSSVAGL